MGSALGAARPGSLRWRGVAVALLGLFLAPAAQAGEPCGARGEPWVVVLFADGSWRPGAKETILLDLRAGLASHHIEACSASDAGTQPPAAAIRLSASEVGAVHVTVNVHDSVTKKELSRDVDLSRVPSDGHSFAIALAADELLWASWAEIALHRQQRKIQAPPKLVDEVARAIEPSAPRRTRPLRLGMQLSAEHYARGLTQVGPDIVFSFNWSPRWASRIFGGYREGLTVDSTHGQITSSAIAAGLDLSAALLQTSRFELTLALGESSAWCHFEGNANSGGVNGKLSGLAIYAQSNLLAALRLHGPIWLQFAIGAGFALRGVEAIDSGRVATGMAGFRQSALVALMGEL